MESMKPLGNFNCFAKKYLREMTVTWGCDEECLGLPTSSLVLKIAAKQSKFPSLPGFYLIRNNIYGPKGKPVHQHKSLAEDGCGFICSSPSTDISPLNSTQTCPSHQQSSLFKRKKNRSMPLSLLRNYTSQCSKYMPSKYQTPMTKGQREITFFEK